MYIIDTTSCLSWNEQYNYVVENMNKKLNIIINGPAGVGKTFMINKLNEQFKMIMTASTGTAAVSFGGFTIDCLLMLHQHRCNMVYYDDEVKKSFLKNEDLNTCDYIVIDEISMIDGHKFDDIIIRLKYVNEHRQNGNIKLMICGDSMQLPPVDADEIKSGYYFKAGSFEEFEKLYYTCKLLEVKRQNNKDFIELLKRVRLGIKDKNDIKYINEMKNNQVNETDDDAFYMCAKNKDVDIINKKYFDENKNEPFEFIKKIKYYIHKKSCKKVKLKNCLLITCHL